MPALIVILILVASPLEGSAQVRVTEPSAARVFLVRAKLTGYCRCKRCCERYAAAGRTKLGTDARLPTGVAAAQRFVPLGAHVYIEGIPNPRRLVDDSGGGMRKHARKGLLQFDVRFRSHAEALRFGVRYEDVYVFVDGFDPEEPTQEEFFLGNALFAWDDVPGDPDEAFAKALSLPAIVPLGYVLN